VDEELLLRLFVGEGKGSGTGVMALRFAVDELQLTVVEVEDLREIGA